jgi:nickel/cobalt transporter (NicO) family protein
MRRAGVLALVVLPLVLVVGPAALAHPLGNFTVNRYAEIVLAPEHVDVHYVLDMAEIPTFQEQQRIGLDGDGSGSQELRAWGVHTAATIVERSILEIDGRRIPLRVEASTVTVLPGQGGLSTWRLEATFRAPTPGDAGFLRFEDQNDPDRLGWREISARATAGIELASSTVPAASVSDRLRTYPDDLLSSPLAVTAMEARFRPGETPTVPEELTAADGGSGRPLVEGGGFATLVGEEGLLLMLVGMLAAVAFGAWHALLPGHGKTLMAAAMVGSGAPARQALVAGIAVASMHTVSVIALGLLVIGLEHAFRPEAVYPWLRLASGIVALGLGLALARGRWRSWRAARSRSGASGGHPEHGGAGHTHDLPAELLSRKGIAALAFAGGVLPSPSALVVMLAAVQRGRAAYGVGLVLAFSVGLAASLVAIGLGVMRARHVADRRAWVTARRVVPVLSATAIVLIGLYVAGTGAASL